MIGSYYSLYTGLLECGILHGLPNLRVLKLAEVEFKFVEPFEAVLGSQRIVLGALEELSLGDLSFFTFGTVSRIPDCAKPSAVNPSRDRQVGLARHFRAE